MYTGNLLFVTSSLNGDYLRFDRTSFLPIGTTRTLRNVGWFINPSFDRDVHLFGATNIQSILKIRISDDSIINSVTH